MLVATGHVGKKQELQANKGINPKWWIMSFPSEESGSCNSYLTVIILCLSSFFVDMMAFVLLIVMVRWELLLMD